MATLQDIDKRAKQFHIDKIKGKESSFRDLWGMASDLYEVSCDKSNNYSDVYEMADRLVRYSGDTVGTKEEENCFASCMLGAYAYIGDSGKFSVSDAKKMLVSRKKLGYMLSSGGDKGYAYGVAGLEYKEIADFYVKNATDWYEKNGQTGEYGNAIVENCTKIVSKHPDLAEKCSKLVDKIVDLNDDNENIIESAIMYCNHVIAKGSPIAKNEAKKMKTKYDNLYDGGYQYEMNPYSRSHTSGGWEM